LTKTVQIDGSLMEGGGSIVRNAIALSALLKKPVKIRNIRAKRSKPGLRNQHLHVVKAIGKICQAEIEGAFIGSQCISFIPGETRGGTFQIDVQTAGSLTLLLQALIPVASFAPEPVKLLLKGGTDVPMAPPFDFFKNVYLFTLQKLGLDVTVCLGRRGHYPKGGGIISCDINPIERLKPISFDGTKNCNPLQIKGIAHAVQLPCHIAERMLSSAATFLQKKGYQLGKLKKDCPEQKYDPHIGPGTGITLWAETDCGTFLSGSGLGKKGLPAETVGESAAKELHNQLQTKCPVDYHLADQLILWMAIVPSPSVIKTSKITLHTLTNIAIVKRFIDINFQVDGAEGTMGVIRSEVNESSLLSG